MKLAQTGIKMDWVCHPQPFPDCNCNFPLDILGVSDSGWAMRTKADFILYTRQCCSSGLSFSSSRFTLLRRSERATLSLREPGGYTCENGFGLKSKPSLPPPSTQPLAAATTQSHHLIFFPILKLILFISCIWSCTSIFLFASLPSVY